MSKLHELAFELLPYSVYSLDLALSNFFLFLDLKWMLAGKKSIVDEEVTAGIEVYFEAKDKSYYKNGMEKLYDHYNRCIALEDNYIE